MNSNVTNLADKSQDNRTWNPEQMLQKMLDDLRLGKTKAQKAIVILLDESNNCYNTTTRVSGLKSTEQVALLEIVKHDIITSM